MYDLASAALSKGPAGLALAWYDRHRRALPWRASPGRQADPYVVWLSEIMLQQTTVTAVKPYFAAFLSRWPNVRSLAEAPAEDVLRQWAGLGYYSRARNLHACAKKVTAEHGGQFPRSEAALRALPGIGPYTAAAIAAIAFGRRAVVVDGNVERVVARLCAIAEPLPASKRLIADKAGEITPYERPGDYAQAMMDLGATVCTPRKPTCALCPLSECCEARVLGEPEQFPRKAPKPEKPTRRGAIFFVRRADGFVLVRTRPNKGLLGGMTEFPGTEWCSDADTASWVRQAPISVPFRRVEKSVEHVFTHFRLTLEIFAAEVPRETPAAFGCRWVGEGDLDREALPSVMRKVLRAVVGAKL